MSGQVSSSDAEESLLPRPVELHFTGGFVDCSQGIALDVRVANPAIERTSRAIGDRLAKPAKLDVVPHGDDADRIAKARRTAKPILYVALDAYALARTDEYRLDIGPEGILLAGRTPRACFHGLQTLSQLPVTRHGIPCCRIVDYASFATRGLLHDVTRGKVPTPATLKHLVDRLAALKINQFQLYIEHAFTFGFDHDICGPEDGLTPDEIRELDRYCRDRFIDLVPAVATLGHMGRILSMPKYRHLAEIEPTKSWAEMSWPERARGFTLDVMNPESHRLVERIWSEILGAFSSPVVNICGDEPWDLGKGKNRANFAAAGTGPPYVDHLLRTHRICEARGRRVQVWSDVVRNHPELFDRLPRDLAVLHWGYDDRADYEGTRAFVESGLPTLVCPGTSGWKRILNAVNLAERNISRFAAAGLEHGASGLINTDWGDHGHFNLLAGSWQGIALGAALAWRSDHPTGEDFDRRFARVVWSLDDHAGMEPLRRMSAVADRCETWRLFWQPLSVVGDDSTLPGISEAEQARSAAADFQRWAKSVSVNDGESRSDLDELRLAAQFTELFADRVAFARGNAPISGRSDLPRRRIASWKDALTECARSYGDLWLARNKRSGLDDILDALRHVAGERSE